MEGLDPDIERSVMLAAVQMNKEMRAAMDIFSLAVENRNWTLAVVALTDMSNHIEYASKTYEALGMRQAIDNGALKLGMSPEEVNKIAIEITSRCIDDEYHPMMAERGALNPEFWKSQREALETKQ